MINFWSVKLKKRGLNSSLLGVTFPFYEFYYRKAKLKAEMRYTLPEKDYLRDPVLLKGYQNLWF